MLSVPLGSSNYKRDSGNVEPMGFFARWFCQLHTDVNIRETLHAYIRFPSLRNKHMASQCKGFIPLNCAAASLTKPYHLPDPPESQRSNGMDEEAQQVRTQGPQAGLKKSAIFPKFGGIGRVRF
jgi:hypothetical protein